ncbi:hypothetical protein [Stigmatella aurantiaca]|uniref:Uncharacterized protein n=1 Tax=Stigmatella aurantiaca (strain DW4/3-1) TaxID=378806 RepID=E3FW81_STIAD|nr:hypothetical protein [Stigmatella aurantiaca]ADO75987.1 uncharacterized protein STAUR_8232 [Stigmatella aurantiaca DW4/3-1]
MSSREHVAGSNEAGVGASTCRSGSTTGTWDYRQPSLALTGRGHADTTHPVKNVAVGALLNNDIVAFFRH